MANMIGAFFGKGMDSHDIFDHLKISGSDTYQKNINRYDVIYIDFSKMPNECSSYSSYISRIEKRLKKDLLKAFPDSVIDTEDSLWDMLDEIFEDYAGRQFMIDAKVDEFAASAMELKNRDQIYSAMVVYGLLTFHDGKVFIPNKELMLKYGQ